MFTGLIRDTGTITKIETEGQNRTFTIQLTRPVPDLRIDESIAHNGVCLTVVAIHSDTTFLVTAVSETLLKTTAGDWKVGHRVNIERAMKAEERLGGHFVQGHVDGTARCRSVTDRDGSVEITFDIPEDKAALIVEKGSVTLNGISLTIFNLTRTSFTVAVIPFTWEHTTIHTVREGDRVNIEYDIIGKYMQRTAELYMHTHR